MSRCVLGPSLGSRRYEVDGVPKHVRYWRATVARGAAARRRTRRSTRCAGCVARRRRRCSPTPTTATLVDAALALPDTTATVVLRHAEAMKRAAWQDSGDPLAAE